MKPNYYFLLAVVLTSLFIAFSWLENSWAKLEIIDVPRPVVVELFTSQGCSSCPPADKVLGELTQKGDNILALSFHVDYWNYIGWEDPFSSAQYTERQRNYGHSFGLNRIYTPQMVIDGTFQTVGSKRAEVFDYIEVASKDVINVTINIEQKQGALVINLPENKSIQAADVLLVGYETSQQTNILRGENKNLHLTNSNVVKYVKNLGRFNGVEKTFNPPHPGTEKIAVIIQSAGQKRVIGAAVF